MQAALAGSSLEVLPQWQEPALTLYALYPSRRHLSAAAGALFGFLVRRFTALVGQGVVAELLFNQ